MDTIPACRLFLVCAKRWTYAPNNLGSSSEQNKTSRRTPPMLSLSVLSGIFLCWGKTRRQSRSPGLAEAVMNEPPTTIWVAPRDRANSHISSTGFLNGSRALPKQNLPTNSPLVHSQFPIGSSPSSEKSGIGLFTNYLGRCGQVGSLMESYRMN